MWRTLPLEKIRVKQRLFWQKMDITGRRFDHGAVKRTVLKRPPRQYAPVYLAEWLRALQVAPVELVKAGVISEGYLSLLRSGKRINPSPGKLMQIGQLPAHPVDGPLPAAAKPGGARGDRRRGSRHPRPHARQRPLLTWRGA
jgi:hypothetical protein